MEHGPLSLPWAWLPICRSEQRAPESRRVVSEEKCLTGTFLRWYCAPEPGRVAKVNLYVGGISVDSLDIHVIGDLRFIVLST